MAAALGEMAPLERVAPALSVSRIQLARRREEWAQAPGRTATLELLAAALLAGDADAADEAAQSLEHHDADLRALAARAAQSDTPTKVVAPTPTDIEEHRARIRRLRARTRLLTPNPFAWLDLAREYVSLGQNGPGERAIRAALHLAPQNRFVLRSASRFYLHAGEAERAHRLLERTARTRQDPWLQAALLASGMVLKRPPARVRDARSMLDSARFSPRDVAELAVALGTLEAESGKRSRARRFTEQALTDPTENAVAQAAWLERRIGGIHEITESTTLTAHAYEARAWEQVQQMRWVDAVSEARRWQDDEPFARRPAHFGSFVAMLGAADFHTGATIARRGLTANPDDPILLNNLAVALASLGQVDAAADAFGRIPVTALKKSERIAWLATRGLLLFRSGAAEEGRQAYQHANQVAEEAGMEEEQAMALLFLAREEMHSAREDRIGISEAVTTSLAAAGAAWKDRTGPNAEMARGLLIRLQGEIQGAPTETLTR